MMFSTENKNLSKRDNVEKRISIIEKLKNLYTHSEPNTNLFRAIREIKEQMEQRWTSSKIRIQKILTIIISTI